MFLCICKAFNIIAYLTITFISDLDNDEDELMTSAFDVSPPETLAGFKNHWLKNSSQQTIVIDRHSSRPLRDIFKLHKKGIDIRAIPDVEFKGEDGTDASEPTREYFYLSMRLVTAG